MPTIRAPTIAAEMLLTGRRISSKEAKKYGLIGHIVPKGKALEKAIELAHMIEENSPVSIRAIMTSLREFEGFSEKKALEKELEIQILADGMHYERSPSYHNQVLKVSC